jgi:hypothetical protein
MRESTWRLAIPGPRINVPAIKNPTVRIIFDLYKFHRQLSNRIYIRIFAELRAPGSSSLLGLFHAYLFSRVTSRPPRSSATISSKISFLFRPPKSSARSLQFGNSRWNVSFLLIKLLPELLDRITDWLRIVLRIISIAIEALADVRRSSVLSKIVARPRVRRNENGCKLNI